MGVRGLYGETFDDDNVYTVVNVADNSTTVYTGPCLLIGIRVETALSAHALPIIDGSTTVYTLAASTGVGTVSLPGPTRFSTSLIVDPNDAATGSITVVYRPL